MDCGHRERTTRPLTDKQTELYLEGTVPVGIQLPNGLARAILQSSTVPRRSASSMGVQLPGRILGVSLHHWAWAAFFFLNCGFTVIIFSPTAWFVEATPPAFNDWVNKRTNE